MLIVATELGQHTPYTQVIILCRLENRQAEETFAHPEASRQRHKPTTQPRTSDGDVFQNPFFTGFVGRVAGGKVMNDA